MDVMVIGAGIAGLRTATLRAATGDDVTVVDKGRRHGGRMATRRVEEATFDSGVIDLAAHGPTFVAALASWSADGAAATVGSARWRGHPTMRSLPTMLADRSGAHVRLATTVTSLEVVDGRWRIGVREIGPVERYVADALVLTTPAPQALALLSTGTALASSRTLELLESVRYEPSLTVLARPSDRTLAPGALIEPTGADLRGTALTRVHRGDLNGVSGVVALTLQATAAFSADHLDGDRDAAAREVAAQAAHVVGTPLEVVHVHGWRYAQVTQGVALPALRDDTSGAPLVLAGDLFDAHGDAPAGVRPEGVERAFTSGGAAARLLDDGRASSAGESSARASAPWNGEGP